MSKNYIFGISLLTAVSVFFFASVYALYLGGIDVLLPFNSLYWPITRDIATHPVEQVLEDVDLHDYIGQLLVWSLVLAVASGFLVSAFLFYRHRDKQ